MDALNLFIRRIQEKNDLNRATLSKALGFSCENALTRVLSGKAQEKALLHFEQMFRGSGLLSHNEIAELHDAVQIRLFGEDRYSAIHELDLFFHGEKAYGDISVPLRLSDGETVSLDAYLRDMEHMDLTVCNCAFPGLADALIPSLQRDGVSVRHYVHDKRDVRFLLRAFNLLAPLVPYARYSLLCHSDGAGLGVCDAMVLEGTKRTGETVKELIVFDVSHMGTVLPADADLTPLIPGEKRCEPVKWHASRYTTESFGDFCKVYSSLEENCSIIDMKPDPSFMLIPVRILWDMFANGDLPPFIADMEQLKQLRDLFRERNDALETKHKATHCLMWPKAIRAFSETGMLTDHPKGMRPFTKGERAEILRYILKMAEENPYFNLYVMNEDAPIPEKSMCCYYERGVYISCIRNDYASPEAFELLLKPPDEFYTLYSEYFHNGTQAHHGSYADRESAQGTDKAELHGITDFTKKTMKNLLRNPCA